MVAQKHFQRLKHLYAAHSSSVNQDRVAISYGRAELDGVIERGTSDAVMNRMSHQDLLSDVSSLAAGSLEKDRVMTTEQFTTEVEDPTYEGPVVASAEVVIAEPPRYVVQAVLLRGTGELVAEARGVFRPSEEALPPDPSPEEGGAPNDEQAVPTPPPASVMPLQTTPYGVLFLN